MTLPRIMVAPNGARLQKTDHPALPITQDEIVGCARACHVAGAGGIHAHLRDANGAHLLDAGRYRALVQALQAGVPGMQVQITTEAVGIYDAETQIEVALTGGADMVSVSTREVLRAGADTARAFFKEAAARGIAVQHILYDVADCDALAEVLGDGLTDPALQLLYVLGRYDRDQTAHPQDLDAFLDWQRGRGLTPDWAICAFGQHEIPCLVRAAAEGGKCRIGFENSRLHPDGRVARDNADKVAALVAALDAGARGI